MNDHGTLHQELERRILQGLICEWKLALPKGYTPNGISMRMPAFEIREMKPYGRWHLDKRLITLSRKLVMEHSWQSVREVLHHEMAHQMADEVLLAEHEPPHGPAFHRACNMLNADPAASGTYPPLDERLSGGHGDAADPVLIRIKKLLSLAQSPNPHEAEAAMAKAHSLIDRYNVDLIRENTERDFLSLLIGQPALRHFREYYHLSGLLSDFYFVECIWVRVWVMEKGKEGSVLEISGTPHNIQVAEYVHTYIQRYIDGQWHAYRNGTRLGRRDKTTFAIGILDGFRQKLTRERGRRSAASTAPAGTASRELIRLTDPQLKSYIRRRYPYLRTFRQQPLGMDDQVFSDGRKKGKKLVISKGLTSRTESDTPRMIGG